MVKITLFGLAGTGTTSVGKSLAEDLGYSFVSSGNIFRELAKENGYSLAEFGDICKDNSKYDKMVDKRIKNYRENDNIVVDSRLAWYFIHDSFKVKFDCDFNTRINRVAKRDEISVRDAMNKTIRREESEKNRYKNYYGIEDYSENNNFDFLVDASEKSILEIVLEIKNFL
jgi:cytidylate kinase